MNIMDDFHLLEGGVYYLHLSHIQWNMDFFYKVFCSFELIIQLFIFLNVKFWYNIYNW
jgi:hypothetical protein